MNVEVPYCAEQSNYGRVAGDFGIFWQNNWSD